MAVMTSAVSIIGVILRFGEKGEPGKRRLGFTVVMAGLDGRRVVLGFTKLLAAAFEEEGEPGSRALGFTTNLAGLDGRTALLAFKRNLAAV
jgi:hypothetical protein